MHVTAASARQACTHTCVMSKTNRRCHQRRRWLIPHTLPKREQLLLPAHTDVCYTTRDPNTQASQRHWQVLCALS